MEENMGKNWIKSMASRLPEDWQIAIRRRLYAGQIRRGTFRTPEPEWARLDEWVREGDWALDIGANIGHYTKRLSELAGATGRVVAFEPVAATFHLLSSNARHFAHANVTLLQAAVSDGTEVRGMKIPSFATGLKNYYEAELAEGGEGDVSVLTLAIDRLGLPGKVALVKIDAEGHERAVLAGMEGLIAAQHPVLIVETGDREVVAWLEKRGYKSARLDGSPNFLFTT
jgi:FkbM family methyltransferase